MAIHCVGAYSMIPSRLHAQLQQRTHSTPSSATRLSWLGGALLLGVVLEQVPCLRIARGVGPLAPSVLSLHNSRPQPTILLPTPAGADPAQHSHARCHLGPRWLENGACGRRVPSQCTFQWTQLGSERRKRGGLSPARNSTGLFGRSLTSACMPCSNSGTTVDSRYARMGSACMFNLLATFSAAFSAAAACRRRRPR